MLPRGNGRAPPPGEGRPGDVHGSPELVGGREQDPRQHLLHCGVGDIDVLVGARFDELAADEEAHPWRG